MFYFSASEPPAWLTIERTTTSGLPLQSYLYSTHVKKLKKQTKNPFVKNTLSVWHEAHAYTEDAPKLSQFAPIWGNDNFLPGRADSGFKHWANKGLCKIIDLYMDGNLMTLDQLICKYDIPRNHFFKYLQLRSFIKSQAHSLDRPSMSVIEKCIVSNKEGRGQMSALYGMLRSKSKDNSHCRLNAWRGDLGIDITENEWENACLKAQTKTINTALRLIQYKWLFRTYVTPVKLHHYNPNIPDSCTKCNDSVGTLLHCMWECQKIQPFWKDVTCMISRMTNMVVPLEPKLCILGIYPNHFAPGRKKAPIIDLSLLQARRAIALRWKNMGGPTYGMWVREVMSCLTLEKLTYLAKGKLNKFTEI